MPWFDARGSDQGITRASDPAARDRPRIQQLPGGGPDERYAPYLSAHEGGAGPEEAEAVADRYMEDVRGVART